MRADEEICGPAVFGDDPDLTGRSAGVGGVPDQASR